MTTFLGVVIVVSVACLAFRIGSGLERTSSKNRYVRATKGELETKWFKPGRDKKKLPYFRANGGKLMSDGEFAFYRKLWEAVGEDYDVMTKVRAAGVIGCSRANWAAGYGTPIAQKELDFVLVKAGMSIVVAAVELDDKTHDRPERIERDEFLDAAFEAAGVPLIRFKAQARYEVEVIREHVRELLGKKRAA